MDLRPYQIKGVVYLPKVVTKNTDEGIITTITYEPMSKEKKKRELKELQI